MPFGIIENFLYNFRVLRRQYSQHADRLWFALFQYPDLTRWQVLFHSIFGRGFLVGNCRVLPLSYWENYEIGSSNVLFIGTPSVEAFTIQIGWTWTVSVLSFPVRVSSSAAEGFPVSEFILVKVFLGPGLCGKVFLYCRSGHSSSNLIKAFTSVSGCLFQKK